MTELRNVLKLFSIKESDVLLVHASLKGISHGEFMDINKLIETILSVLPKGTLCMPTFDYSDVITAHNTWEINKPSGMGRISEIFRTSYATSRSDNPTHSIACWGKFAEFITEAEENDKKRIGPFGDYCFSQKSAFQKMCQLKAKILFLGVDIRKNTFKHYVEYRVVNDILEAIDDLEIRECATVELLTYDYITSNHINIEEWKVVPKNTKKIWLWTDSKEMENDLQRRGILKTANFKGITVFMIDNAFEFCEWLYSAFMEKQQYLNESAALWIRKYSYYLKKGG